MELAAEELPVEMAAEEVLLFVEAALEEAKLLLKEALLLPAMTLEAKLMFPLPPALSFFALLLIFLGAAFCCRCRLLSFFVLP